MVLKIPSKGKRWLKHWLAAGLGLKDFVLVKFPQKEAKEQKPFARQDSSVSGGLTWGITAWILRLFSKTADLFALPEFIDFLWQIVKPNTRKLNPLEYQEAYRIFQDSLPYDQIRIDESAFIARLGARFARAKQMGVGSFYTVNFTRSLHIEEGSKDMAWLIHELVHVAQMHYVGSQYTLKP